MGTEKKRGFAAMTPERRKEVATMGGKRAHANGTAHEWDSETGRAAGIKGGLAVSRDSAHMAAIGRIGNAAGVRKRNMKRKASKSQRLAKLRQRAGEEE